MRNGRQPVVVEDSHADQRGAAFRVELFQAVVGWCGGDGCFSVRNVRRALTSFSRWNYRIRIRSKWVRGPAPVFVGFEKMSRHAACGRLLLKKSRM